MFIESKEVDQGSLVNSDICIIGAGAAGISMAREFVGTSYEVTVLESGGLTPDQKPNHSIPAPILACPALTWRQTG